MITPQEFVAQWGTEDLVRYDPDVVGGLSIPETSKRFLIEAGLPRKAARLFVFDLPLGNLPPLPDGFSYQEFPTDYRRYRWIGSEVLEKERFLFSFICLDEQENGRVVRIFNEEDLPVYFLNSSVMQLAEYFLILRRYSEWWKTTRGRTYTVEEWETRTEETEQALRQADPEALQQSEHGWYDLWNGH